MHIPVAWQVSQAAAHLNAFVIVHWQHPNGANRP